MEVLEIAVATLALTDPHDTDYLDGDYMEIVLEETDMDLDDLECDYPMNATRDMDDPETDYPMDADPVTEETEDYYDTVEQPETEMEVVQDETVVEMCDVGVLENGDLEMGGTELAFGAIVGIAALQMMMSWIQSEE